MVRVRPGFAGEVATDLSYLARNVKEPLKTSQKTPRNSGLGWFRIYSFGVFLLGTVSRSHSINFYLILDLTIGLYFDIAMEPWRFAQSQQVAAMVGWAPGFTGLFLLDRPSAQLGLCWRGLMSGTQDVY